MCCRLRGRIGLLARKTEGKEEVKERKTKKPMRGEPNQDVPIAVVCPSHIPRQSIQCRQVIQSLIFNLHLAPNSFIAQLFQDVRPTRHAFLEDSHG